MISKKIKILWYALCFFWPRWLIYILKCSNSNVKITMIVISQLKRCLSYCFKKYSYYDILLNKQNLIRNCKSSWLKLLHLFDSNHSSLQCISFLAFVIKNTRSLRFMLLFSIISSMYCVYAFYLWVMCLSCDMIK